jgi:hypothetical protein
MTPDQLALGNMVALTVGYLLLAVGGLALVSLLVGLGAAYCWDRARDVVGWWELGKVLKLHRELNSGTVRMVDSEGKDPYYEFKRHQKENADGTFWNNVIDMKEYYEAKEDPHKVLNEVSDTLDNVSDELRGYAATSRELTDVIADLKKVVSKLEALQQVATEEEEKNEQV